MLINVADKNNFGLLSNVVSNGSVLIDLIRQEKWNPETYLWDVLQIIQQDMFELDIPENLDTARKVIKSRLSLGSVKNFTLSFLLFVHK